MGLFGVAWYGGEELRVVCRLHLEAGGEGLSLIAETAS